MCMRVSCSAAAQCGIDEQPPRDSELTLRAKQGTARNSPSHKVTGAGARVVVRSCGRPRQ